MSLASQVGLLVTRIATEFNTVRTEIARKVQPAITGANYNETIRANNVLTGGGTITWTGTTMSWSSRFIVISNGNGANFSTAGYFDISMPANATVITGVGGSGNKTVSGGAIPLTAWDSLYYILPIGSNSASVTANLRVVSYASAFDIPDHWVLIAQVNGDDSTLKVAGRPNVDQGRSSTMVNPLAQYALSNDSRLSDTRTPTDGSVTTAKFAAGAVDSAAIAAAIKDPAAGTAGLRTLGTGAQQAAAGTDSRLSDTRAPTAGSVTNASFAAGAVDSAAVSATIKDPAAGTAGLRTLGTGATQAAAGNDARLSDSRTPTSHTHPESQVTGGTGTQYLKGGTPSTWATLDKSAVGLSAVTNAAQVDLTTAQTIAGVKNFSSAVNLTQQAAFSSPPAGSTQIYAKADDRIYTRDSSGSEKLVGPWGVSDIVQEAIGMRANAVQAITTATATKVAFAGTNDFQVGAITKTSDEAVISVAGVYHVSAGVQFVANATGVRRAWIEWYTGADPGVGLATRLASQGTNGFATYTVDLSPDDVVTLPAGAHVRLVVFQTSGGSLNTTNATPGVLPRLNVRMLSAATQYGQEMGYAESTTSYTNTNTTPWSTTVGNLVTGLSVTVTGTGRPALIEFFAPQVFHSVANVFVGSYLVINGLTNNANSTAAYQQSTGTSIGPSLTMSRRLTLAAGTSYVFQVGLYGVSAGTAGVICGSTQPMYLSVVQQ